MVHANVDFLIERGSPPHGFYIRRFDHKGEVLDARADLYDQAFMLLALAHAGRALARPDLFAAPRSRDALEGAGDDPWRLFRGRDRRLPTLPPEPAYASPLSCGRERRGAVIHRCSSFRLS